MNPLVAAPPALLLGVISMLTIHLGGGSALARSDEWPAPEAIHQVLEVDWPTIPAPEQGETNTQAYLERLEPRVLIPRDEGEPPLIARTNLLGDGIAYLRLGNIRTGSAAAVAQALQAFRDSTALAGVVVDLRLAGGSDHDAAAETAGLFCSGKSAPLRLGERSLEVPARAGRPSPPVVVLIHRKTRGAAETLAAAVRHSAVPSLLIGTNTFGAARPYREITLPEGQRLLLADGALSLPDGRTIGDDGLVPDILVTVPDAEELAYLEDPFQAAGPRRRPESVDALLRMNEAELVRRRRGLREMTAPPPIPSPVVIRDPLLARAVDILDGLRRLRETGDTALSR